MFNVWCWPLLKGETLGRYKVKGTGFDMFQTHKSLYNAGIRFKKPGLREEVMAGETEEQSSEHGW